MKVNNMLHAPFICSFNVIFLKCMVLGVVLILYYFQSKDKCCRVLVLTYFTISPAAQGVLISAGIIGSVVVFPIGLTLLFACCCCFHKKESDEEFLKQFHDCKLFTSLNQ